MCALDRWPKPETAAAVTAAAAAGPCRIKYIFCTVRSLIRCVCIWIRCMISRNNMWIFDSLPPSMSVTWYNCHCSCYCCICCNDATCRHSLYAINHHAFSIHVHTAAVAIIIIVSPHTHTHIGNLFQFKHKTNAQYFFCLFFPSPECDAAVDFRCVKIDVVCAVCCIHNSHFFCRFILFSL